MNASSPQPGPLLPQPPTTWQGMVRSQLPLVLRQERLRWIFVLRVVLAGLLALWVSQIMNLTQPATALITVLSIMQARSGDVLGKSLFRLIGNFAGGLVAVVLFSLFAQQRVLLILMLAVWVFFCTAGAEKQRNNQSYGFMIAGYAACLICTPVLNEPNLLWHTAILRVTEIFVGIVSCSVIAEIIFPDTVSSQLYIEAQGRLTLFDDFVRGALTGRIPPGDVEEMQLRFIKDVAMLDSYGASAAFEASGEVHKISIRLFNSGFMSVSSSFSSLYSFLQNLSPDTDDPIRKLFTHACNRIAETLAVTGGSAKTKENARKTAQSLEECREELALLFPSQAGKRFATRGSAIFADMGEHLIQRFLEDMRAYLMYYAELSDPKTSRSLHGVHFTPSIDMGVALAAGLRAGLTVLLLCAVWWGTALTDPVGAHMVNIAVVFCAMRASDPNPARSLLVDCLGVSIGILVSMIYSLLIEPQMNDCIPLYASFFAILGGGLYFRFIPSVSGPARMGCIIFATFTTPELSYATISAPDLLTRCFSELGAFLVAAAMHAFILPQGGTWWRNHLSSSLLREGAAACHNRLENIVLHFESGIRDVLLQFTTNAIPSTRDKQAMLRKALSMSDIGRTAIELRKRLHSSECLTVERKIIPPLLHSLYTFLCRPAHAPYRRLLQEIQNAAELVEQARSPVSPEIRDHDTDKAIARLYLLQGALMWGAEMFRFFDHPADGGVRHAA